MAALGLVADPRNYAELHKASFKTFACTLRIAVGSSPCRQSSWSGTSSGPRGRTARRGWVPLHPGPVTAAAGRLESDDGTVITRRLAVPMADETEMRRLTGVAREFVKAMLVGTFDDSYPDETVFPALVVTSPGKTGFAGIRNGADGGSSGRP